MKGSKPIGTGIKIIKTSATVLICLLLFKAMFLLSQAIPVGSSFNMVLMFLLERENALFACVAAVATMYTAFENSIEIGISRVWGAAVGSYFGFFLLWVDSMVLNRELNILFTLLGVAGVILICRLIKKSGSEIVALVIFLIIMLTVDKTEPFLYAASKIIDIAIGICVALVINALICHKDKGTKIIDDVAPSTESENNEDTSE